VIVSSDTDHFKSQYCKVYELTFFESRVVSKLNTGTLTVGTHYCFIRQLCFNKRTGYSNKQPSRYIMNELVLGFWLLTWLVSRGQQIIYCPILFFPKSVAILKAYVHVHELVQGMPVHHQCLFCNNINWRDHGNAFVKTWFILREFACLAGV